jgi:hypothetical protein
MALALCALSMLVLIALDTRASVSGFFMPPIPLSTMPPSGGIDNFVWEHTAPWGHLLIDGQAGPDVGGSALSTGFAGLPQIKGFRLSHGLHTIEYRTELFPTLRCTLSVPAASTDTCPLDHADISFFVQSAPLTRILDLQATIDRIPPAQAQALTDATQAQFAAAAAALPTGRLEVGDHYLDVAGHVVQATTPLSVAPRFSLAPDASDLQPDATTPCVRLCSTNGVFDQYTPDGWALVAPVDLTWSYRASGGQLLLEEGPAGALEARSSIASPINALWTAGDWQVHIERPTATQTDPIICPTGRHFLTLLQSSPDDTVLDRSFQWPYSASTADLGCVYAGRATDDRGQPKGPIALVLYHFGALLAANAEAQRIFPHLLVSTAHERGLALLVASTSLPSRMAEKASTASAPPTGSPVLARLDRVVAQMAGAWRPDTSGCASPLAPSCCRGALSRRTSWPIRERE